MTRSWAISNQLSSPFPDDSDFILSNFELRLIWPCVLYGRFANMSSVFVLLSRWSAACAFGHPTPGFRPYNGFLLWLDASRGVSRSFTIQHGTDTAISAGRGVLAMANSGPHSNGSQFYILYKSAHHLDHKHTVFGKVVGGLGTLTALERLPVDDDDHPLQVPPGPSLLTDGQPWRQNPCF